MNRRRRGGVSFSGSETTRQEAFVPDAIAMAYGCHCGRCGRIGADSESAGALVRVTGMIKRVAAVAYQSSESGRRVRGEDRMINQGPCN